LRIGATSFGNRTFDGGVDEVAVFTNALSAATIYAHFQAATTNNANYGAQILAANPAGYWHLDEPAYAAVSPSQLPTAFNLGTLSYLADGTYEAGTVPGIPGVPNAAFGSSNLACAFDANSYIDVNGEWLGFTGPLTMSAWVEAGPVTGEPESVASMGGGSYELTLDGGGHPCFVDGPQPFANLAGPNPVDDGQWHQLTGVYDGTNTEFLYVDGYLVAQANNATARALANGNDFWIGGDPDAGAYQFFNGKIDEVAIFPTALSARQILYTYSSALNRTSLQAAVNPAVPGIITLAWPALTGQNYQVQSCTNLNQSVWVPLGAVVTATNSTVTVSDTTSNAQTFYRLVLVP